ncbi:FAD-dependent oxidoreductase [Nocardia sp. NPDC060259]|uniref:FAD-dependent oxidoreductase n=1 Tax=Nocardia sp. NPDC060259 TaxID=3347088 RepID=UPI003647C7E9
MLRGKAEAMTTKTCDVCIVGAGITGLNALWVASRYLARHQKVVLVDSRKQVGGMWADTYPYVRLHQPHGLFTAGNIAWTLGRERSYLATKPEVLDHLEYCLDTIKQRVQVDELFGWTMVSHDETAGIVRITCESADGATVVVEAKRLIKAYGFRIAPNAPFDVSSTRVRSISPDFCDLHGDDIRGSAAPVWIIGGGKTAMDTALELITEYPGREVNLVAGVGTFFQSRERLFPSGARRWWAGELSSSLIRETSRRFDGTNEADVWDWHRTTYGTWVTPETGSFLLGILSEAENSTIASGLRRVVMDYLVDAVDDHEATRLVFRSGVTTTIPPGSWIVNCTGYVMRRDHPYEPYVSSSGAVLSIQPRSATLYLTSMIGYFLTNLMFLDRISDTPLYELDVPELLSKSRTVVPYTLFALTLYNAGIIYDNVPLTVFRDFGLDFDRWYPLPRRMTAMTRFALTHRRDREHLRRTLDTVRDRFDVRCGPLAQDPRHGATPEVADRGTGSTV